MVRFDLAAIVRLQPDLFETETLGVRTSADRHQHHVRLDRLGGAAGGRLQRKRDRAAVDLRARDLGRQAQFEALLLEDLVQFLADLAVHARQDLVEELHDRDLSAKTPPHRSKLQSDHAAADHDHVLRHLRKGERAGGIDDLRARIVDIDAGQRSHRRTRRDDDVLRGHGAVADLHRVRPLERAEALEPFDLVLLEQELDAAREAIHGRILGFVHRGEVDLDTTGLHAPLGERSVSRFLEQLRRVEQGLRRDAPDVEAGAAERLAALRTGGLEAKLRGADRGDIAARAAADHQHVEVEVCHLFLGNLVCAPLRVRRLP